MTDVPSCDWPGKSGTTYRYSVYDLPPSFNKAAGNYIFAKRNSEGYWVPVYIGQTDDLSERFDDHHKATCISRAGATHIHAHAKEDERERLEEEADILAKFSTPCNG